MRSSLRSSGGQTSVVERNSARSGLTNSSVVLVDHGLVDRIGRRAQHAGAHLHGAGPLQMVHALEGGGDRAADRQRAVIAQQHVVLVAEVLLQARALVMVERDAFIVVIGEIVGDELRGLVQRQQAFHAARHRGAVGRVQMEHAAGVLAHLVDRRMDGEAGRVDAVIALGELVAVEVDLDQAGRRDLVEHQSVGVDQEVMVRSRHPRGDVGVDQIVPAIQRDEAIAGGEIDALAPLGLRHVGRHFLQARFRWRHGRFLPCRWLICRRKPSPARRLAARRRSRRGSHALTVDERGLRRRDRQQAGNAAAADVVDAGEHHVVALDLDHHGRGQALAVELAERHREVGGVGCPSRW